mmetsp:Transcript_17188/g.69145  ORF Transcript_17188/g.69145 Transcript_17188/m.69145 type:complete len:139 (+) Transcript_17188:1377-1793(+)
MLDRAAFGLSALAAHVAAAAAPATTTTNASRPRSPLRLVAQAKCDRTGRVVALHQNWRAVAPRDATALVVVDLRLVTDLPWDPDINDGFDLPDDLAALPPHLRRTVAPAPTHLLRSLAETRARWRQPDGPTSETNDAT